MLAGSVSVFESCNSGNASKDAVDSVEHNLLNVPSNKDTSKTTTSTGGATLLDYSGSGGIKMKRGGVSSRNTMAAPASVPTPVAAADTAKKDTTKK